MLCERDCGRRAVIHWRHKERDLTLDLCAVDSAKHEFALTEQRWEQAELAVILPALSADPLTH